MSRWQDLSRDDEAWSTSHDAWESGRRGGRSTRTGSRELSCGSARWRERSSRSAHRAFPGKPLTRSSATRLDLPLFREKLMARSAVVSAVALLIVACGTTPKGADAGPACGTEGQACCSGLTCNVDLVCTAGTCAADPCASLTCSGHGSCAVVSGTAACTCDAGYNGVGTECLAAPGTMCGETSDCDSSACNATAVCGGGTSAGGVCACLCTVASDCTSGCCHLLADGSANVCMSASMCP